MDIWSKTKAHILLDSMQINNEYQHKKSPDYISFYFDKTTESKPKARLMHHMYIVLPTIQVLPVYKYSYDFLAFIRRQNIP